MYFGDSNSSTFGDSNSSTFFSASCMSEYQAHIGGLGGFGLHKVIQNKNHFFSMTSSDDSQCVSGTYWGERTRIPFFF